jgi:hypothetical protein
MLPHCVALLVLVSGFVLAQVSTPNSFSQPSDSGLRDTELVQAYPPISVITHPLAQGQMGPDRALQVYQERVRFQAQHLGGYSAAIVVRAQLVGIGQRGEYALECQYAAPRSIRFTPLHYAGDAFVKSNVIMRVLQSEVDRVQKGDEKGIAISPTNYSISYRATIELDGRLVHDYEVRPRKKRKGLFRGHIYVDIFRGTLARTEGYLVKVPSLFVKTVQFVQDYADFGEFTFPVHLHSSAHTRVIGPAVVDVYSGDYQPMSLNGTTASPTYGFSRIDDGRDAGESWVVGRANPDP